MRFGKSKKNGAIANEEDQKRQEQKEERRQSIEHDFMDSSITFMDRMGQSFTSVASSVTSPPSYSGIAFAKYLQAIDDEGQQQPLDNGSLLDAKPVPAEADARAASTATTSHSHSHKKVMKKKKKKKSKKSGILKKGFFGSISEEENAVGEGTATADTTSSIADSSLDASQVAAATNYGYENTGVDNNTKSAATKETKTRRRRRRRSLFGNSGGRGGSGSDSMSSAPAEAAASGDNPPHSSSDSMRRSSSAHATRTIQVSSGVESVSSVSNTNQSHSDDGSIYSASGQYHKSTDKKKKIKKKYRRRRSFFGGSSAASNSIADGDENDNNSNDNYAPDDRYTSSNRSGETTTTKAKTTRKVPRRRSMFGGTSDHNNNHNNHNDTPQKRSTAATAGLNSKTSHSTRTRRRHSLGATTSLHNDYKYNNHGIDNSNNNHKQRQLSATQYTDVHRIVNQERIVRGMTPYIRNPTLDALASDVVYQLATNGNPSVNYHGNVGQGKSLDDIHATMMKDLSGTARKNILSSRFVEFGMAIYDDPTVPLSSNSRVFVCQLFRQ